MFEKSASIASLNELTISKFLTVPLALTKFIASSQLEFFALIVIFSNSKLINYKHPVKFFLLIGKFFGKLFKSNLFSS